MIGLTDIDLKQTHFYQNVLAEGLSLGENQLLLRQIRRRFGTFPQWVEDKLSKASTRQKELWGDRILDAPSLEVLFAETGE
jgi:hypothetical protein